MPRDLYLYAGVPGSTLGFAIVLAGFFDGKAGAMGGGRSCFCLPISLRRGHECALGGLGFGFEFFGVIDEDMRLARAERALITGPTAQDDEDNLTFGRQIGQPH